jgi:hypothetical protein
MMTDASNNIEGFMVIDEQQPQHNTTANVAVF